MILELDCGNSFIKWRVIDSAQAATIGGGVVGSDEELISALRALNELVLRNCRLVSVRSDEETRALTDRLQDVFGVVSVCVEPAAEMSGVRNGYSEFQRLGLDRWLAVLGAYHIARKACLVLDLGTAVTSDLVAENGEHLGGFICPGMPLMRNQLRTHTRRIRYDDQAAERALLDMAPGRSTVEAVERGCLLMLRGFVQAQIELAAQHLGDDFEVFLTGGDALLVKSVLPRARVLPDLVFAGLAIACPLP
ncbi:pantothenate kinase [Pseudomonas sp. JS3066]|uniref:pantothenate kinase n=1 Tax=unclassified Pseudomonas TaxID=196821 RepID=UPI000EA8801C|nr:MULTISPECIES: pantothenate kinase [unclassified Pseudomonas]AYF88765.1 pantothenate kinase [Pseudomonas sp. DY-1]MDH4651813.1 pantothenate kinase [Pseudomonas sp. BN606]MRK20579.1 pantothenate kinase [Pseudomonas sp. JG-B]WVK93694.1 pantothenate kinase [Pseudomonas sp. JS3066]